MTNSEKEITLGTFSQDPSQIIIENYRVMTYPELAEKLGVEPRWVKRQVTNLIKANIIAPKNGKGATAKRSTQERTAYIIENHKKMSREELAEKLGENTRWIKRQIANLIKANLILPKRKKENPSVSLEDWSPQIVERAIYLNDEELKTYDEISQILKKEFEFSVSGVVVGMWLRKFGHTAKTKIDWLDKHITVDIANDFLSKNMTMVEISAYIKENHKIYISDDLILTHFKNIGVMSQRQYAIYLANYKGEQVPRKWLEDNINNHVSQTEMSRQLGVSETIVKKRLTRMGLSLLPRRKIWSNNLELLRDELLKVNPITLPDNLFHECMLGWLFGDGHVDINGRFVVNHSLKQLDYIYLKIRVLKPYLCNIVTVARANFSGDGTCLGSGEQIGISCPGLSRYTEYLNDDGSKNFDKLLTEMTPLSWACLYMDDGSYYSNRSGISTSEDRCKHFKNRYNFGDHINDHTLEVKDLNPEYLIPGMASKVPGSDVGSFWREYAPELFDPVITKDYQLSFLNNYLCGKDPKLLNNAVEYYQNRGFPYFKISEEYLRKEFNRLKVFNTDYLWKTDNLLRYLDVGNHIFKHFMPHMVEARFRQVSPLDVFNNFMQFRSVLEYTLKLKKPILPDFVFDNLVYFNGGVTGFPCSVAKAIASKYCPKDGLIVDPCAGWGGRLLGAVSCDRRYIGYDAWEKTVTCHNTMREFLNIHTAEVVCSDFSDTEAPDVCDLVFTSPPYFDLEIYGKKMSKKEWVMLLESIFRYSERALKDRHFLILNLPKSLKYELPQTYLKELPPIYFHTSSRKKSTDNAEILYIWQK